jgi:hypothetical protein
MLHHLQKPSTIGIGRQWKYSSPCRRSAAARSLPSIAHGIQGELTMQPSMLGAAPVDAWRRQVALLKHKVHACLQPIVSMFEIE